MKFQFLLVALLICLVSSAVGDVCMSPELPTDLDLITSVEASDFREVHLHGMYGVGVADKYDPQHSALVHNLTLRAKDKARTMRVSVSPHSAVEMSLWLYRGSSSEHVTCSMSGGRIVERNLFAHLEAGESYTLSFRYSVSWREMEQCSTVMMELAVQPDQSVAKFSDCPDSSTSPTLMKIVPSATDKYYFSYSGAQTFFMRFDESHGKESDFFTQIAHYPIVIPHLKGRHNQWKLNVDIQSRFLDGGDVAALVTLGNRTTAPEPSECVPGENDEDEKKLKCIYGTRALRNHFVIQDTLWAGENGKDGEYILWLVTRKPEKTPPSACAPYSIDITLFPLQEQETFITCDVDPLPPNLNAPGMYNEETGILVFESLVLVNLSTRIQDTLLSPTKERSLIRVRLGNHRSLDIDLILLEVDRVNNLGHNMRELAATGNIMAASMGASGPEGVVFELTNKHSYIIRVNVPYPYRQYEGQDHDFYEFCDTYELGVHVFPILESDSQSCSTRKPALTGMQEKLNDTHQFSFDMLQTKSYPYAFDISLEESAQQRLILKERFFVSKTSALEIVAESDRYGGTAVIELRMDGSSEVLYSHHRTVGSSLHADIEEGWYELRLLTPVMQMTTKTFKEISDDFPQCVRYNLKLFIRTKDTCLTPLELPEEFALGRHNHDHLFDEYRIPADGHHRMKVQPDRDVIVHMRESVTDAPLNITVIRGESRDGDVVAVSHQVSGSQQVNLMVVLHHDEVYTIDFRFDMDAAVYGSCKTLYLQMSVTPLNEEEAKASCERYPKLKSKENAITGSTVDFFANYAVEPKSSKSRFVVPLVVSDDSHVRVNLAFDFTRHSFNVALCACDDIETDCPPSKCLTGYGFRNTVEIFTQTLQGGSYALIIEPWPHGINGDEDVTLRCSDVRLHVALAPAKKAKPQLVCNNMVQYLPKSLNGVGMLWPFYHDEMHFKQDVRISTQHQGDETSFTIAKDSIMRVYVPLNPVTVSLTLRSDDQRDKPLVVTAVGPNQAIFAALPRGTYKLILKYYIAFDKSHECESIPIELSIMKKSDVSKVAHYSDNDEGCDTSGFPTKMFHLGHEVLHRKPGAAFRKVLNFTVGTKGARYDVDVRYGFEAAGLGVALSGNVLGADGSVSFKAFMLNHFSDRTYREGLLEQGNYSMTVFDPVPPKVYEDVTHPSCTPYSVHLRFQDFDDNSGDSPQFSPMPTVDPQLDCPGNKYDFIPSPLGSGGDSISLAGEAFRIPFENGVDRTKNIHGKEVHFKTTTVKIPFSPQPGSQVRGWIRSLTKTLMQTSLKNSSGDSVADGEFFGWHTQTISYTAASGDDMVLEITFYHTHEPKLGEDYNTCDEKRELEIYELFFAVFPTADIGKATECPGDLPDKHSPPKNIDVGNDVYDVDKLYYFTQDDAEEPQPTPLRDPQKHVFSALRKRKSRRPPDAFAAQVSHRSMTTVTIPASAGKVALVATLRYNIQTSNMRLGMYRFGSSEPLSEQDGGPLSTVDNVLNAESSIIIENLTSGTYNLAVEQANAQQRSGGEYCLPYKLHVRLVPEKQEVRSPHIVAIEPGNTSFLDASDPLMIQFKLSDRASATLEHRIAKLVSDDGGEEQVLLPDTEYFADTSTAVSVWTSYRLGWGRKYKLVVDATGIKTMADKKAFISDIADGTRYYSTATCGCNEGKCAAGGACHCNAANGESCFDCVDGFERTKELVDLGVGDLAGHFHICSAARAHPKTPKPATPSDTSEPAPPPPPTSKPAGPGHFTYPHGPTSHQPSPTKMPVTKQPPVSPSGPQTETQRAPLHTLRYTVSFAIVIGLLVYALVTIAKNRSRATRTLQNPFRSGTSLQTDRTTSGAAASGAFDVDDDDDDVDESHAIIN